MVRNIGFIACLMAVLQLSTTALYAETIEAASPVKGDALKGKRFFNSCLGCHAVKDGDAVRSGPHLKEVFGRKAGTLQDFRYSSALKTANFVWNEEKLDEWLKEPRTFLPGNRMTFTGLSSEQERKDLLAYMKQVTIPTE